MLELEGDWLGGFAKLNRVPLALQPAEPLQNTDWIILLPCLKPFDGSPLITESSPGSSACPFSSPRSGSCLPLQPFPSLWTLSTQPLWPQSTNYNPWAKSATHRSHPKLRMVFIFLNSYILNDCTSTNTMSLILPLGQQSLQYLLSGPL